MHGFVHETRRDGLRRGRRSGPGMNARRPSAEVSTATRDDARRQRRTGKTGSVAKGVVYLDGYAGRGRYQNGTPASAERILQIAEKQGVMGINYRLFFYESDPKSYAILKPVWTSTLRMVSRLRLSVTR